MTSSFLLFLAALCLMKAAPATNASDGDFAFVHSGDIQANINHGAAPDCPVRRLWGVPDMPAYVGRMFRLRIPKVAFSGKVTGYKVTGPDGSLPPWLSLDSHNGVLRGVPAAADIGEHRLLVTALYTDIIASECSPASDVFTIEVKNKKEIPSLSSRNEEQCHVGEDISRLIILIGRPFHQITPKERLNAIIHLASFMALEQNEFTIQPQEVTSNKNSKHDVVIMSGPGDSKKKHIKVTSEIVLDVGCSGTYWPKHRLLVHQIAEQVKDGTISYTIQLPVAGWRVVRHKQAPLVRKQRQISEGSAYENEDDEDDFEDEEGDSHDRRIGEDENYEDMGNGDDYSGYNEYEDAIQEVPPPAPPIPPPPQTTPRPTPHHHRHHHGEPQPALTDSTSPSTPIQLEDAQHTKDILKDILSTVTLPQITSIIEGIPDSTQISVSTTVVPTPPPTPISVTSPVDVTEEILSTVLDISSTTLTATTEMTVESIATSPRPEPEEPEFIPIFPTLLPSSSRPQDWSSSAASPVTETSPDQGKSPIQIVAEADNATERSIEENVISKSNTDNYAPPIILVEEGASTEEMLEPVDEVVAQSATPETVTRPLPRRFNSPDIYKIEEEEQLTTVSDIEKESTFNVEHVTSPKDTTPADTYTTEKSSTIIGRTTETVIFTFPANSPPQKQHRTKKVAVTAGKYFIYIIPEDLFLDAEDGKNLQLAMYDIEHAPLKSSSWVQFNPQTREVYGLPLEEHVSKWEYIIEATDSKGASVTDTLDITVQQHKGRRTVNHEFSMKLRVLKKFHAVVDWQIKALRGLVSLFRDTDMDQITVRDVNITTDLVEFIWTNDTLPRNYCPTSDIDRLMGILQSTPDGEPSTALSSAMAPDLKVKGVTWIGMGECQAPVSTAPPLKPNLHPMPRNQIDHINATVGKLLLLSVKDDTFYDHEDGSSRYLKVWLTRGDTSPIPSHNWLQFDVKNREFFGVPMEKDIGKKEYHLMCEDSGGLIATDSLLVEVHPDPIIRPSMEFRMTLDSPANVLMQTAAAKRKFVEKLQTLFNDSDPSSIKIKSITYNPTIISWYNTSLPTDRCPERKIEELKRVMVRDDDSLTDRLDEVMGKDMPVSSLMVDRRGICAVSVPAVYIPDTSVRAAGIPAEDASKTADSDDYLITFIIPIVVIVCMIVIAALVACILYRRRRTGKMSIGDDEERQAFRSKGIPVIFQDELDEKPDPCNKSPVIMKEEKPPLLPPPEYKGADGGSPTPSHAPYHPPPPFTASRDTQRNNRPKPTPTYRKPPPYVPP